MCAYFLYSERSFNNSSSFILLLSCLYIAGKSEDVSNSLLYNLNSGLAAHANGIL